MNTPIEHSRTRPAARATLIRGICALFSVGVSAFGVIAVVAPSLMAPTDTAITSAGGFFGTMVGVRNIPLGAAVAFAALRARHPRALFMLSAIVQLGDVVVGTVYAVTPMAISAAIGTVVYTAAILSARADVDMLTSTPSRSSDRVAQQGDCTTHDGQDAD